MRRAPVQAFGIVKVTQFRALIVEYCLRMSGDPCVPRRILQLVAPGKHGRFSGLPLRVHDSFVVHDALSGIGL